MYKRLVARLVWPAFGILLAAVVGCGPTHGALSGKVTYKNKAVVTGGVTVIGSDGIPYTAQIEPDGTYSIPAVPEGPVKIAVTSPNPGGEGRGTAPAERPKGAPDTDIAPAPAAKEGTPKKWFIIPEKYGDPLQSGLTGTVRGNTVLDLSLTD